MMGISLPGKAMLQRITIIRKKPNKRNIIAVIPYCRPMTLWSVEKT